MTVPNQFIITFILFFTSLALAKFDLPQQMNAKDRQRALEILGSATSSRLLSSAYPLGGWQGLEVGLSRHYIPASYLSSLGDRSATQNDFNYPMLTIGKGLYGNVDLHVGFVPMFQSDAISHASAQIRYQLWKSPSKIFRLSGLVHASTTNLLNQLIMQNYGFNIIGITTIDELSLFVGAGLSSTDGRFIGGNKGITDSKDSEQETKRLPHQLIGLEYLINNYFVAAEIDRYDSPYYSLKVGYRL